MTTQLNGSKTPSPEPSHLSGAAWGEATATKTLDMVEMETLVELLQSQDAEGKRCEAVAADAWAKYEETKQKIMKALEDAGKKSYKANIGLVTRVQKSQVTTPKTIEQKQALFKWIHEQLGEELMWSYTSFNSQSLQTFYQEQQDLAESQGRLMEFKIPGLDGPTMRETLSFTKAKTTKKGS